MKSYDSQSGGYKEGMNPYDTYHSWAASQYKDKVRDAHLLPSYPWRRVLTPAISSTLH